MIMISVQDEVGVQSEQSLHYESVSLSHLHSSKFKVYPTTISKRNNYRYNKHHRRPVVVRSWCHILNFLRQSLIPSDIYPLQVGVCVRRTMNIRNGIKPTIQATDLTCNATQLATCNLQLVYRRLLVLLLKSLLATRLSAASRTSTLLLPSPLRSLLSAASTSSLISSCGGTTASDDDPPANTK